MKETTTYKLRELCYDKIAENHSQFTTEYTKRLDFELCQMEGLAMENTFLVCYHLAQLVEKDKGFIGPSTALSSSSLVLYLLGASMVNPLEHGLLFEHFFPIDRVDTITIGIDVDMGTLERIRNQFTGSQFLFENMYIKDSTFCDVFEISIDDNTIQLSGSKILTEILKTQKDFGKESIDFTSILLENKDVFHKLISSNHIIFLRKIDNGFLAGFNVEYQDFLKQYAPKSIEELAQSLAYLEPWCNYDLDSILKRRKGVHDLTQFQKKFFKETNGIYTFPEQVSSMLQRYLGFSRQETQSYQIAVRKKVNKLYTASEELFFQVGEECNYDQIDLEQLWHSMKHYNLSMTDKTRKVGEALLLYWWVYSSLEERK